MENRKMLGNNDPTSPPRLKTGYADSRRKLRLQGLSYRQGGWLRLTGGPLGTENFPIVKISM